MSFSMPTRIGALKVSSSAKSRYNLFIGAKSSFIFTNPLGIVEMKI
jgi:hypothetical protein